VVMLEIPIILEQYGSQTPVFFLLILGWTLWICGQILVAKLDWIVKMLTPAHVLLKDKTVSGDAETGTAGLLADDHHGCDPPPYESEMAPTVKGNKHEMLFWGAAEGPHLIVFFLRVIMLTCAVSCALLYTWLIHSPNDTFWVCLAALPVLHVLLTKNYKAMPLLVMSTSVEQMRDKKAVDETILEMKTEKSLRILRLLGMLEAQAKRIQKLGAAADTGKHEIEERVLDKQKEVELRQAFELFDKDGSGSIDENELAYVMKAMGMNLSGSDLKLLYHQMDADGSGVIEFKEFVDVMAPKDEEPKSPEEVAESIFSLLDKDGSGSISVEELVNTLVAMELPGLNRDDITAAVALFNHDSLMDISQEEFVKGVKLMQTFG